MVVWCGMDEAARTKLADSLDGLVVLPGDPAYDETRAIWNAIVDHRPATIVRCASVGDVVTAVRTAREHDLEIGIRCGGHSAAGHAVPDGGLMVDLTPLRAVRVDPKERRAVVQGGAMLGSLDRATQEYGLAVTAGNVSHTGVGGLTLGGGGGNFGVVTEFEFRLHDIGTEALSVEIDFPVEQAASVLRGWRDLNAPAPREATFTTGIGGGVVTLGFVWVGDPARGVTLVPDIRALGPPAAERVVPMSYVQLQTRDDVVDGHARRRYQKGHYFRDLTDEVIDTMVAVADVGPYAPGVGLQAYGGAIADVPEDDAAFSHRDTAFELGASTGWTDPGEDDVRIETARSYAATLEPFASGVYVNVLGDEGAAGVRRAYSPEKLARLTTVKDTYDPRNVFHLNQNIRPSTADT